MLCHDSYIHGWGMEFDYTNERLQHAIVCTPCLLLLSVIINIHLFHENLCSIALHF